MGDVRYVYLARFGESLRIAQEKLNAKNFYAFNPEFDTKQRKAMKSPSRR